MLPKTLLAVARAAQVQRLRTRLDNGDYPLSLSAVADALIAYGYAAGELVSAASAARRVAVMALMADALAQLTPRAAIGLQLSLVEQLPDTAIAQLLGTTCDRLAKERKVAFAVLCARLAG